MFKTSAYNTNVNVGTGRPSTQGEGEKGFDNRPIPFAEGAGHPQAKLKGKGGRNTPSQQFISPHVAADRLAKGKYAAYDLGFVLGKQAAMPQLEMPPYSVPSPPPPQAPAQRQFDVKSEPRRAGRVDPLTLQQLGRLGSLKQPPKLSPSPTRQLNIPTY